MESSCLHCGEHFQENATFCPNCGKHRRTGLEIWGGGGGGGHEFARLAPKTREPLGGFGAMFPREILNNGVSLMPFPAFRCGFLCMEKVTNEKKILRILVKQNMNRKIARILSKIARLINISDPPPAPPARTSMVGKSFSTVSALKFFLNK